MIRRLLNSRIEILVASFLFLLTFAVYSQILNDPLVSGDHIWCWWGRNDTGSIFSGLSNIMSYSLLYSFRPVPMATWWMQCSLFGFEGMPSHMINVFIYAGIGCLLFWFLLTAGISRRTSLLAAVLLIVTPIAPEMVTFSSGRTDLVGLFFMLLSLIFYLKFAKTRKRHAYLVSLGAFSLSILSKEEYAILIILIPLIEHLYVNYAKQPPGKRIILFARRMAPFAAVIAAYGLAVLVMMKMGLIAASGAFAASLPQKVAVKSLLLALSPLSMFKFSRLIFILLGAYVFFLLIVSAWLVIRDNTKSGKNIRRVYTFMVVLILIAPIPTYKYIFVKGLTRSMEFSHFLSLSNMGILVLLSLGFELGRKSKVWRMPAYAAVMILIPILAWGLIQNNRVWEDKAAETSAIMDRSRELLPNPPLNARLYYKGLPWNDDGIPAGAYNSYAIVYIVYSKYDRGDMEILQWKESSEPELGEKDYLFIVDLNDDRITLVMPDGARTSSLI